MRVHSPRLLAITAWAVVVASFSACQRSPDTPSATNVTTDPTVFTAYELSRGPGIDCSSSRFDYPRLELDTDRKAHLLVEIDRLEGMPRPSLSVDLRGGTVDLAGILKDVGLATRIEWSDELPRSLFGDEPWPGEERLKNIMKRFKNVSAGPDEWALYLLLVEQQHEGLEISCVIDPAHRSGAIVSIPVARENPGAILHAIGHEIGHLLNLPHPWEDYGNTRSLMSYPWRWEDWDWSDPSVYYFDDAGRHHILRGPEVCVRPGAQDVGFPSSASSTGTRTPTS